MTQFLTIKAGQDGIELDEYLCQLYPRVSKRELRAAVRDGRVRVNAMVVGPSVRLGFQDVVSVDFDEEALDEDHGWSAPAEPPVVLYEDEHCLVLDKPPGLPVEPERWEPQAPCLLGALQLLGDSPPSGSNYRPRLVHRIDKETSGCVLVAKTVEAERGIRVAFDNGLVTKRYFALVEGELRLPAKTSQAGAADGWLALDLPIGPAAARALGKSSRDQRHRQSVHKDGQAALTLVRPVTHFRGFTWVECEPRTGRTHQIRVHLANEGFPLAVDSMYGRRSSLLLSELKTKYRQKAGRPERPLLARLSLHAHELDFPAIGRQARIVVRAPVPDDLTRTLKQLAKVRPGVP